MPVVIKGICLDRKVFETLEKRRGLVSRSRYVTEILRNAMGEPDQETALKQQTSPVKGDPHE